METFFPSTKDIKINIFISMQQTMKILEDRLQKFDSFFFTINVSRIIQDIL